jgi:hypothetical protein
MLKKFSFSNIYIKFIIMYLWISPKVGKKITLYLENVHSSVLKMFTFSHLQTHDALF